MGECQKSACKTLRTEVRAVVRLCWHVSVGESDGRPDTFQEIAERLERALGEKLSSRLKALEDQTNET